MKLVDLNLLIYAIDEESPAHAAARGWLEEVLSGTEEVGFAWAVLLGFVRLTTNPAVFDAPLDADEALDVVEGWLAQPVATVVEPSERHTQNLRELLTVTGTAGNLTTDAHLAALAIEHGAELCSRDSDFSRFPGLRWRDPLA
ncbi:MAG TPA: type II toxin-antitoxin system VapC family toxin [Solirubrobacterales bacterium]|nr:type II toxin-antitoxin system VapC family toxin [Solirubrobacterales bacterium]